MKSISPLLFLLALGLSLFAAGCVTNDFEGEGPPAEVRYSHDQVKQMFLKAYQKGDRKAGLAVAAPEAVAKVPWNGDPRAFLEGDSILSGEGGFEIKMEIHSDGHVGANIVDVIVRH